MVKPDGVRQIQQVTFLGAADDVVDADLIDVDVVEGDRAGRHDDLLDQVAGEDEAEEHAPVPAIPLEKLIRIFFFHGNSSRSYWETLDLVPDHEIGHSENQIQLETTMNRHAMDRI